MRSIYEIHSDIESAQKSLDYIVPRLALRIKDDAANKIIVEKKGKKHTPHAEIAQMTAKVAKYNVELAALTVELQECEAEMSK